MEIPVDLSPSFKDVIVTGIMLVSFNRAPHAHLGIHDGIAWCLRRTDLAASALITGLS
ncbi:hypothetical protein PT974_02990 [Cladobotryum mycophilum]|uniref:Uncharacterized protein n=1 Tax=Cladobotryum mycophilum TaxID=491253 RepID=A0ABR0T0U3_9HYPO